MLQRKYLFVFLVPLLFLTGAGNAKLSADCDLGLKLREFDSRSKKTVRVSDGKLSTELLADSLFVRDDERYVEALKRLVQIAEFKTQAVEKMTAFVDRPKNLGANLNRERRAKALLSLLKFKEDILGASTQEKIVHLLSVELAETVAAKELPAQKHSDANWLRRIEVLNERNENALLIAEIAQKRDDLKRRGLFSCRVQFLLGKALRKNRSYKESMEILDKVSKECTGDDGRDADFLLARLSAITPSQEHMKYFDAFEKKHSQHSYFDDVLIFKASALESLKRVEDAKQTLRKIAKLDFTSDMRFEAYFRLAFMYALEGDSVEAVKILKESLQDKSVPGMNLMERHRALYWSARLQLFANLFELPKLSGEILVADKSDSKRQLEDLANAESRTFYSLLSRELLKNVPLSKVEKSPVAQKPVDERKITDPVFSKILCLAAKGFEDYARRFVEIMDPSEVKEDERTLVARRLSEAGMYDQVFRFASSSEAKLIYPQAFRNEVEAAAKQVGLPRNLVYGLMREESRFDARVISWAGARGLLQLMPSVARGEATKFKIKSLSEEEMLDPKINILLGAEHLRGMLAGLRHPLFAVAAYNAGFQRVKDWEQRFGKIKAIDAFVENIPLPETRNYVKRVAASWVNYSSLYPNKDPLFELDWVQTSTLGQVR